MATILSMAALPSPLLRADGAAFAPRDSLEKTRKAATDFEALLLAQMLKSARESGGGMTGDADEEDETNSAVLELGEQQLAQVLSNNGGFGIAKIVIAGMKNHANR